MKNETVEVLKKNTISNNETKVSCCGGAPSTNKDACCQLDEEKKAEGEAGCGCNSTDTKSKASCC
ncbi:MAG: hypothetical protein H0W73_12285 [Bacteroidetes bacterium]|nr:hypothetical protein [Bacteroidota bacterium]